MAERLPYDAVTFDFWNTLILETGEVLEVRRALWSEALGSAGFAVSDDQLTAAFRVGWDRFDERWRANQPSDAIGVTADVVEALDLPLPPTLVDELGARYLEASELTPRSLLPEVEETLDRLRGLGLGVGVVCDVGTVPSSRLRAWLDELGVLHLIDHCSFSDEVGVYKPHATIFEHALAGVGASEPGRVAHVGDLKRTDVAGARAMGMTSVRYRGGREDTEEGADADHVIDAHLDLLDALGLR